MRKRVTITALVLFIALASPMWAQLNDVYQTHPFLGPEPPTIQIVNPGEQGTPLSKNQGTLCADIYVFDFNQEMVGCCSCPITANGVLTLVSALNLLSNPLTGIVPQIGVYKIVSDSGANCNEKSPVPTPALQAWAFTSSSSYDPFRNATLLSDEQAFLGQACSFVQYLGSGRGKCTCDLRIKF